MTEKGEHDRRKNQENFLRRDQQVGVLTLSQSIQNNTKIFFCERAIPKQ